MLTADQARNLRDSMQKQQVEMLIFNILRDVAERALDPNGRRHVYVDLDFCDERVDFVVARLSSLGYMVEANTDTEEEYCSLTVKF